MAENVTFARLQAIIAETCQVPIQAIRPDAQISAYALDSVQTTELLCAIEDRLGITVDDDEIQKISTVQELVQYVADRTSRKEP